MAGRLSVALWPGGSKMFMTNSTFSPAAFVVVLYTTVRVGWIAAAAAVCSAGASGPSAAGVAGMAGTAGGAGTSAAVVVFTTVEAGPLFSGSVRKGAAG